MKIYLVGGAVRDQLLDYPVKERDFVVVDGSRKELLRLGFKQVGKAFPVFLHPHTQEEYALARKEKKSGLGHHGFSFEVDSSVSLTEDLARRDLTINAMAMDEEGNLIDPYHGLEDLKAKILRHVSPAFVEDPLRVLRVARFLARYYHLGFKIAPETQVLMQQMAKSGELACLTPERVLQEFALSLKERHPEMFLLSLSSCDALELVLPELQTLLQRGEFQELSHDSLVVLIESLHLSLDPKLRFSALMLAGLERSAEEELKQEEALALIEGLAQRLHMPNSWLKLALMARKLTLKFLALARLEPLTILKILEEAQAFKQVSIFAELLVLTKALGEVKHVHSVEKIIEIWFDLAKRCSRVSSAPFLAQGYQGKAIKEALDKERIKAIDEALTLWNFHEK